MANTSDTIDHTTLALLVEAGAVHGANVIGQPGGWAVVVKYGMTERALAVRRGNVRIFRKFETLVDYLKQIGLCKYTVDAASYDPCSLYQNESSRNRMLAAHAAAKKMKGEI